MMRRFLFALVGVAFTLPIIAQENTSGANPKTLSISLRDAVEYAVDHNRSLQNASLEEKQQHAARWQTIATMLPQVSGSLDYLSMCGYKMNIGGMAMPMNPNGTLGVTAALAFSGKQVVATLLNNLAIEMSEVSKKKTEQTVINSVITTYYTILTLTETIDLLQDNYNNLETLYKRALKAVEVGAAEQISADQIEVQVNTYKTSISDVQLNREVMLSTLRFLLGLDRDTNVTLTDKISNLMSIDETLAILEEEFDIEKNYDYQLVSKNTELAKKQITLAAMDYIPSVSAYYKYSAKTYFGADEGFNMTNPNTVGVSVAVPIWSSGQRASAITQKKLALQSAQNTMMDTKDQLNISNYQLRYNLKNAYDKYVVQKKNVEVSQKVLDNISKKFEYGYASSTEVTTASQDLIVAQTNYVNAVLSTVEAYLNLKDLINIPYN
ncbi:MAG: TolC family protein [Paludibacteraceae bacterium]|nr:TolC family protein [Paludibacteraceae bacterium]